MIDIENLVFNTVFDAVASVRSTVPVSKGYIEQNAVYPCIVLRETNNVAYDNSATDDCSENHARVTYQVDIYSDKEDTARSECRDLLNLVDGIMQGMKFRRTYMSEPMNISRSVYRQYARYTVIVAKGVTTVTGTGNEETSTTMFQMYRR